MPIFRQEMLLLTDDDLAGEIWKLLCNYAAQHRGDRPRYLLIGDRELRRLKLLHTANHYYILVVEWDDQGREKMYVMGVEVLRVARDSFWEIVGN